MSIQTRKALADVDLFADLPKEVLDDLNQKGTTFTTSPGRRWSLREQRISACRSSWKVRQRSPSTVSRVRRSARVTTSARSR